MKEGTRKHRVWRHFAAAAIIAMIAIPFWLASEPKLVLTHRTDLPAVRERNRMERIVEKMKLFAVQLKLCSPKSLLPRQIEMDVNIVTMPDEASIDSQLGPPLLKGTNGLIGWVLVQKNYDDLITWAQKEGNGGKVALLNRPIKATEGNRRKILFLQTTRRQLTGTTSLAMWNRLRMELMMVEETAVAPGQERTMSVEVATALLKTGEALVLENQNTQPLKRGRLLIVVRPRLMVDNQ